MFRKVIVAFLISALLLAVGVFMAAAGQTARPVEQGGGMDMGTPMGTEAPTAMLSESMMQTTAQPHIVPLPAQYEALTNTVPADSPSLSRGAALFAADCAACHGANGQGGGMSGAP